MRSASLRLELKSENVCTVQTEMPCACACWNELWGVPSYKWEFLLWSFSDFNSPEWWEISLYWKYSEGRNKRDYGVVCVLGVQNHTGITSIWFKTLEHGQWVSSSFVTCIYLQNLVFFWPWNFFVRCFFCCLFTLSWSEYLDAYSFSESLFLWC
jgi:hypothetical protein